jgi:MYND finger
MAHDVGDVKALVEEFNSLPMEGFWCIGIEPIFVHAHYVFAFDNQNGFSNLEGRTPIIYVSDPAKEAEVIVLSFLELFVSCLDSRELLIYGYNSRRMKPQIWTLLDPSNHPGLAAAIRAEFRAIGVSENLQYMEYADLNSRYLYELNWRGMIQSVVTKRSIETNSRLYHYLPEPGRGGPPPVFCASPNCGSCITYYLEPLSLCGGCLKAWYCNRPCQRVDWERDHKNVCHESWGLFGQSRAILDKTRQDWQDMPVLIPVEEGNNLSETNSSKPSSEEVDYEEMGQSEKTNSKKTNWSFSQLSETECP